MTDQTYLSTSEPSSALFMAKKYKYIDKSLNRFIPFMFSAFLFIWLMVVYKRVPFLFRFVCHTFINIFV